MTSRFDDIESKIRSLADSRKAGGIFVLTDANVLHLIDDFLPEVPRLVMEPGEGSKSLDGAVRVWNFLEEGKARRNSLLVNVGGGMVSDLGGFAASVFKRGMGCVNIPTTLLAAVDAAIGGKTGINFNGLKNELGAFSMPLAVYPLTSLFYSLPEEEWLSGVGEAIKTAMLDSRELFDLATSEAFIVKREPGVVAMVVERCAAFKQRIVEEDFKERGLRKILNLGHTAGHAVESLKMEQGTPIPHGVAVAHGIRFALERSRLLPDADPGLLGEYKKILEKFFPPLDLSEKDMKRMEQLMAHDKKNTKAGVTAWVLLPEIGRPVF